MNEPTANAGTPFLSREDLAARYGVPKTTLDQWAHHGYGPPYIKIGRFARYRVEDVLAWEDKQSKMAGGHR